MTLPYSHSRAVFHGNGAAQRFPFTFRVWDATQLDVYTISPQGEARPAPGYSVELTPGGGTISYAPGGAPLPEGWSLAVLRAMPFTQNINLMAGTRFDPQVIEDALDMAAAERQQLREAVDRAVKVEPTGLTTPDELIADLRRAGDDAMKAAQASRAAAEDAQRERNAAAAEREATTERAAQAAASAEAARQWAESAEHDVLSALDRITAKGSEQAQRLEAYGAVFAGCIVPFSGTFGGSDGKRPIPRGSSAAQETWVLCDGTNGTPNLRDRMIMGAGGSYATGNTGGATTHAHGVSGNTAGTTTSSAQEAWHTHVSRFGGGGGNGNNNPAWSDTGAPRWDVLYYNQVEGSGGSQPHLHSVSITSGAASSLPPYFALAYIMKL